MKKIFSITFCLIVGLFMFVNNVYAINMLTLYSELKNSTTTAYLEIEGLSDDLTNDVIYYSYTYEGNEYDVEFANVDGVLTFEFDEDVDKEVYAINELLIFEIIHIVMSDEGYSDTEFTNVTNFINENTISSYLLEDNGLTYSKTYVDNDYYINSFYINLTETAIDIPSGQVSVYENSSDSIVLSINIEGDTETCSIYKGTVTGEFEEIDEINCSDETLYTDTFVEEGETYYYKIKVGDEYTYSNSVTAITQISNSLSSDEIVDDDDEVVSDSSSEQSDNPQTGIIFPISVMCILIGSACFLKIYLKNKNKITNI